MVSQDSSTLLLFPPASLKEVFSVPYSSYVTLDSSPEIGLFFSEAFEYHMSIHSKQETNPSKALPKLKL